MSEFKNENIENVHNIHFIIIKNKIKINYKFFLRIKDIF